MSARQSHLQENYNDGLHSTVLCGGGDMLSIILLHVIIIIMSFFFSLRPQLDNVHLNFVCKLVGTVN